MKASPFVRWEINTTWFALGVADIAPGSIIGRHRVRPLLYAILTFAIVSLIPPLVPSSSAQLSLSNTPREETWTTDGEVKAIVSSGDTIYIGGDFNQVAPRNGLGVPVDTSTGTCLAKFPKVDGESVVTCVPDGFGGWYIGGDFDQVGKIERNYIAHILPDYSVDLSWNPKKDGIVWIDCLQR